jgi:glyceraldehyde-3-phosphate dehydrogenase (NADP+)
MRPHVWIAGEPRLTRKHAEVRAPWEGKLLGLVGEADDALVEEAVARAHEAFKPASRLPAYVRRAFLLAVARGVEARRDDFVSAITHEAGKPVSFADAEARRAVVTFTLSAEESTRVDGELLRLDHAPLGAGALGACARVAAGPVLAITPFNFPLNLVAHKLGPAFALGAPVVLKPAPQTPLTAMLLAEVVRDAADEASSEHGLDPSLLRAMLSVVPCAVPLAERMVRDPRLAVLSFTGSAAVGWRLREIAGRKRVLLELGGNAALVVAPDGDATQALDRIVPAAFGYAGQVCIKVQRLFVPRTIEREVTDALTERVRALPVLDPADPKCVCGPLIDARSAARVRSWIDEAERMGARVLAGGAREGNRVTPTLVAGAGAGMKLHDEEVFGPVLTVHPYDTLVEAWRAVNASRYGLQAGVFTRDLGTVAAAFRELEVGAVIVNDAPTFRVDGMPYGGVKDSGYGREGVRYAIDEMTERRLLVLRGFL